MKYILFFLFYLLAANTYAQKSIKLVEDASTRYKDENNKEITKSEFEEKIKSGLYQRGIEHDGTKLTAYQLKVSKIAKGTEAYNFTAKTIDNQTIELAKLKGKIVVINFWFTKCMPCVREIPDLNHIVEKYKSNDSVVFLAITHDSQDMIKSFLNNTSFEYQHITDSRSIADLYGVSSFPVNLIIDKEGKISFSQAGYNSQTPQRIEEMIEAALKSAPAKATTTQGK